MACKRIEAIGSDQPLDAIRQGLDVYLNSSTHKLTCFNWESSSQDLFRGSDNSIDVVDDSPIKDTFQWTYQCCTEFVHPQAGTGMFGLPDDTWSEEAVSRACQQLYPGSTWKPYPTILTYNTSSAPYTNVIYYVGLFDPVRAYEPREDLSSSVRVLTAPLGAHCNDVMMQRDSDPQWAIDIRQEEIKILSSWLQSRRWV